MAIFNSYVSHNQRVISKYGFSKNPQVSLDDLGVHRSSTPRALCRRLWISRNVPSVASPVEDHLGISAMIWVYIIYIYILLLLLLYIYMYIYICIVINIYILYYIYIYQILSNYIKLCMLYGWVAQMARAFFGSVQSCDFHGLIGLAARPERFRS